MNKGSTKAVRVHEPCPSCTSSDAYCEYDDGHGYCYSCKTYFPPEGGTNHLNDFTYEYLPGRGITKDVFTFYEVKTKVSSEGKPLAVGFKYPNGTYKVRALDSKEFWQEKNEKDEPAVGLFGRDKFSIGSHKYVTITEGEYDALSLYQVLRSPVVSVLSAGTALRDCSADRAWLNSFERVYLAFDSDQPGLDAARSVAKLFDYNKVYHVRFDLKDANDYLQAQRGDELRNIWYNSKKYLPETIVSSFSDFEKILSEPPQKGVPYPFPTLTEMTYGIRTGESVLITAQEGVGKTEIMHAIEYQLLKETDSAVGAIFLEEPKKRHLQALAGIELSKPAHLPDSGCTQAEVIAAVKRIVQKDERLHIYSHFGSDDPEVLLDTIRFLVSARACRYILLDHITMAVSGLAGEDERRALDYLSTRLEMMVKELDFSLIMVSHVNDSGQTRGSRYIGKIAGTRINAMRDIENPDPVEANTTYLSIAKNRYAGKAGPAGKIIFDMNTYRFKEETGFANDNALAMEKAS